MAELLTQGITRGADRALTITELKRTGGSGAAGLIPTGVQFVWTRDTFSVPKGAWNFGVTQRTSRDDYPGGESPVEQVLGWHYTAFTLNGCWSDKHGGPSFAVDTWKAFELLTKRGNLVRLEFEEVQIVGLITNANFSYKRRDYIEYTFTFSPHFRVKNETVRPPIGQGPRATLDPKTVAKLARASLDALKAEQAKATAANLSQVQQLLNDDVFSEINGHLDTVSENMLKVENIVNDQIFKVEDAANAFLRATQILASVKTTAATMITRLSGASSTASLGAETAVAALDYDSWSRGVCARARELVVQADESQRQYSARATPGIRKLHRARAGESLYAISNQYYGTPHRMRQLLEANGLTKIVLDGGELLVIPEIA